MADAVCAAQSFCHLPDAAQSEETLNTLPGLETSVSFGRFVSESLDWGKFSSFRQNKYIEEVQKSSKPGSVAQMKAHFEAHFKRAAELRAAAKAAMAAGENPNLTVSEQPQIETDFREEHMKSLNDVEMEADGESTSKTFTNDSPNLTVSEQPQIEPDLRKEHMKNLSDDQMEANGQSPSKTFAKENPDLTVPEQPQLETDFREENMKKLNDVEMESNGESPSKTLTDNGETECTETVKEEFHGDFDIQKKRKSNTILASEERAMIIAGFNAGDENQGLDGSPRKIHQVTKFPLQESSAVNREIPPLSPSNRNKQTSTFISSNWSPQNPKMSTSTLGTISRSCPLKENLPKSNPIQENLPKSCSTSSPAQENLTRSCSLKSSPISENLTESSSSKSTPAQKNPAKSCESKSTPVQEIPTRSCVCKSNSVEENRIRVSYLPTPVQEIPMRTCMPKPNPVQENPTRCHSSKSTSAQENPTPCPSKSTKAQPLPKTRNGTEKSNMTSQSVSTSCWNSSRSMWKKPVQAVCSPFKFKTEKRAEKRREFNLKVEEKLKAEKIEKDKKAKCCFLRKLPKMNLRSCARI